GARAVESLEICCAMGEMGAKNAMLGLGNGSRPRDPDPPDNGADGIGDVRMGWNRDLRAKKRRDLGIIYRRRRAESDQRIGKPDRDARRAMMPVQCRTRERRP